MTIDRWARTRLSMTLALAIVAFDGHAGAAHGQEAETREPPAQPTQDADPRPGELAETEAALRQARQAASQANAQIADAELQLERLATQRNDVEQRLSTMQDQLSRTQAAAELEQQKLTDTTARLDRVTQQVGAAEQQVSALTGRVERGTKDATDVEARLAEARRLEEQRAAALRAAMMVRRGDALMQQGDVSAARLLYERAAAAGSGDAATAMGKTFDAGFLTQIGALGLRPDPEQASAWYRRALDLGNEEARTRLQNLRPAAERTRAGSDKHP